VPGADALTPVTVKLLAADHAPCSNAPLTACTRQKYVPLARPLTVAVVWPLVEFWRITGEKLDEVLTCQLYATIPLGSLTVDHESANGSCTLAPAAGAEGVGAAGAAEMRTDAAQIIANITSDAMHC